MCEDMAFRLVVFCVCVTFEGHLSSASRFARACSIGDVQGVALHTVHVAKGRPLRLMRINGRSRCGFLSRSVFGFKSFVDYVLEQWRCWRVWY